MIAFLANIFGYLLNFFYNLLGNYGLAIILFCLAVKIIMIPLSIKQQKSQQKSVKIQSEMKQIQFKYKNDPEKMNRETMELYKREKMSPFSGCLLAIVQMILLFSVFYMVRTPLTYVKKIEPELIEKYVNVLKEENLVPNEAYVQMAVISEANNIKQLQDEKVELTEQQQKLKETFGEELETICTNMNFLGIDLSKVPTQDMSDFRVYIIPILYVISSFVSIKITTTMQANNNKNANVVEIKSEDENEKLPQKIDENEDPMAQANKSMSFMMPIMAVSISFIAPLGLALYWLTNNVLMIAERLILNTFLKEKGE